MRGGGGVWISEFWFSGSRKICGNTGSRVGRRDGVPLEAVLILKRTTGAVESCRGERRVGVERSILWRWEWEVK